MYSESIYSAKELIAIKKFLLGFNLFIISLFFTVSPVYASITVEVDLGSQLVKVFDNANLIRVMICSTGAPATKTPEGEFSIQNKGYMFTTDYGVSAKYYTSFKGWGKYMFHSILFDSSGTNILNNSYKLLGKPVSHGCIRLNVHDAIWFQHNIPQGTPVKIYSTQAKPMKNLVFNVNINNQSTSFQAHIRTIDNQQYIRTKDLAAIFAAQISLNNETVILTKDDLYLKWYLSQPLIIKNDIRIPTAQASQLFYDGPYIPLSTVEAALKVESIIDSNTGNLNFFYEHWLPILFENKVIEVEKPTLIYNDRTYIPVRSVAEALQCQVEWHENTRKIILSKFGQEPITLTLGSTIMYQGSVTKQLENPVIIHNDVTRVPLRTILEALGYTVEWEYNQISIKKVTA